MIATTVELGDTDSAVVFREDGSFEVFAPDMEDDVVVDYESGPGRALALALVLSQPRAWAQVVRVAEAALSKSVETDREHEHILCAAIYVDTGKKESNTQSYAHPKTGLVFSGWRHNDCFTAMYAWIRGLSFTQKRAIMAIDRYALRGANQGFLTSKGRYLDREEAYPVAAAAGQLRRGPKGSRSLDSEDLY